MIRIWADFNSMTPDRKKVAIFSQQAPEGLQPGQRVVLYEPDDFEVEATIELQRDNDGNEWLYGVIHWETSRDLASKAPKHDTPM